MTFTPKPWRDTGPPDEFTDVTSDTLIDLERRVTDYTDDVTDPLDTRTDALELLGVNGAGVASSRLLGAACAASGSNPSSEEIEAFNLKIAPRRLDMVMLSSTFPTSAALFQNQIDICSALDVIPHIIWSPSSVTLGSITSGSQDATLLTSTFRCQGVNGPVIMRLAHEMNISSSYGMAAETAASYIAGWQYVVNYFRAHNATNVLWCWSPNYWTTEGGIDPTAYYPGDDYVDLIGWDGYFYNAMGTKATWRNLVLPDYLKMRAISRKPFMVTETGVAGGVSGWPKNTYFEGMFGTLLRDLPTFIGFNYWNQNFGGGIDDTIDTSGTDLVALAEFVKRVNAYPFDDAKDPDYDRFGSGFDGTVNFDGTLTFSNFATTTGSAPNLVYTLTRDVHANILSTQTGITVKTAGFRIFARMLVHHKGTFQNNGNNASVGTGGATSSFSSIGVTNAGSNGSSGVGFGGSQTAGLVGGSGGAGGSGTPNAGGSGRSPVNVPADGIVLTATGNGALVGFPTDADAILGRLQGAGGSVWAGGGIAGSTGGGDGTNPGGGGGSGGGIIHVAARVVYIEGGTFQATGGNGGTLSVGNCGGGGGGGGGAVFVVAKTVQGTPTLTLTGGTGGTKTGTGVNGSNGVVGNYVTQLI